MSGLENWRGSARERAEVWGRASDNGQVYQSAGDQYVTHIHLTAEARGQAAHEVRKRADVVAQVLARAVGELVARCEELEEQAKRAKAEGRAEAHAEFSEKLRDAELSVIQAQRMMREAEEERAKAEALLSQAQQELARQRRAAERERGTTVRNEPVEEARERQEAEQFAQLLEKAEAELGAVRDELRQLNDEMQSYGAEGRPTVLVGEAVGSGADDKVGEEREEAFRISADGGDGPTRGLDRGGTLDLSESAEAAAGRTERQVAGGSRPTQRVPAPPRRTHSPRDRVMGVVTFLAVAVPLPIAGSAIRTMYSAQTPPAIVWGIVFDLGVLLASVIVAGLIYFGLLVAFEWTEGAMIAGCAAHVTAGIGLFITGIVMDPETVPRLTQAGRFVVEYFGPL